MLSYCILYLQTCPNKCEELQPCVQCKQFGSGPYMNEAAEVDGGSYYPEYDSVPKTKCDLCTFEPIPVERAEDYVVEDEKLCTFFDDDECQATFVYGYQNTTGQLVVSDIVHI